VEELEALEVGVVLLVLFAPVVVEVLVAVYQNFNLSLLILLNPPFTSLLVQEA
jgi:hypothetical protein